MESLADAAVYGATDPIFLLLAALVIEAYVGDLLAHLPRVPHPRALLVRLTGALERRLNRPQRSRRNLVLRGAAQAVALTGAASALGALLAALTRAVPYAWIAELLVLVALVGQRSAGREGARTAGALESGDLDSARGHLNALAGDLLDPAAVARWPAPRLGLAAVMGLGERFAGSVVAPVFWYVLLGLPGVLGQQALRTIARVVATGNRPGGGGYDQRREGDFAFFAVRLDLALTWVPDKLAGLYLAAAAVFVPTTHALGALKRLPRGHWWSVAALGGALHLAARRDATLSPAAAPGARQVGRALGLFTVGCLINAAFLGLLVLARHAGLPG